MHTSQNHQCCNVYEFMFNGVSGFAVDVPCALQFENWEDLTVNTNISYRRTESMMIYQVEIFREKLAYGIRLK